MNSARAVKRGGGRTEQGGDEERKSKTQPQNNSEGTMCDM